jgi:Xaa-Pro aminopeptidase
MKRINNLLTLIQTENIDALLITSEANISYLTGFTGDSSRLILANAGCFFLTDGRYTEQAKKECYPEINIINWIDDERYGNKTYNFVVKQLNIKQLGFESDEISFTTYQNLNSGLKASELFPTSGLVEQLRIIKDDEEIQYLKRASEISDKALELTLPFIKTGVTELDILARLEYNLKTNGADALSFDTMVLSGTKTSLLHGKADHKKIENGDFILFDFGALYNGYHADTSRTFVVGKPSNQQKEMYEIIRIAQENACKSIKHGVIGTTPDTEVRNMIPEKYIKYYYPGLGHGVGLQIHENPFIKNTSDFVFKKNMTVTIEPGIYIPDFGGLRIEDTIVVTENGFESLNKFPRDLISL